MLRLKYELIDQLIYGVEYRVNNFDGVVDGVEATGVVFLADSWRGFSSSSPFISSCRLSPLVQEACLTANLSPSVRTMFYSLQ